MNRSEVLRHLPTLEMFMEQGVWLTLRLRNGHMIRRFCCHEIWALPSPNSSAADYLAVEAHGECRLEHSAVVICSFGLKEILTFEDEHLLPYLPNPKFRVAQDGAGWILLKRADAKEIVASNTKPLG